MSAIISKYFFFESDFCTIAVRSAHVAIMEVGRVLMSSVFLLCFVLPYLFSVKDAGSQHKVSYSQYSWTFWDHLKSNSKEFNLDLLPVTSCAGGHFVPLLRKKFIKAGVAYSANQTASFNPAEVTLIRSGDIHPHPGPEKRSDLNARSIKNRNHRYSHQGRRPS